MSSCPIQRDKAAAAHRKFKEVNKLFSIMRMSSSTRFINLLLISNFLTSITFFGLIWIGFGPICTHSLSLPWIFTWLNFMAILEFLAPSPCCYLLLPICFSSIVFTFSPNVFNINRNLFFRRTFSTLKNFQRI
uniref:Uncharacterized protein n=1 Tax=Cacopsylla melanoneura TaxID=428564 RepID=A0A8D9F808_9HEMI